MEGKAKMAGARLEELERIEAWSAENDDVRARFDTQAGSRAIADGSMPELMQETLGRLKPEAAYFGPEGGVRTAFIVFDLLRPLPASEHHRAAVQQAERHGRDDAGDEQG